MCCDWSAGSVARFALSLIRGGDESASVLIVVLFGSSSSDLSGVLLLAGGVAEERLSVELVVAVVFSSVLFAHSSSPGTKCKC
jgi:hypothetical protein